jgi:hypothetical protein
MWILERVKDIPSRQSIKTVQLQLGSLEITSLDLLLCIRILASIPWSPASDHAADTLLKRLGELLSGSGPEADKATDADRADEVRAEMKSLAIELMRAAISETDDDGVAGSSYLHPKALLKLIRVSRCAARLYPRARRACTS